MGAFDFNTIIYCLLLFLVIKYYKIENNGKKKVGAFLDDFDQVGAFVEEKFIRLIMIASHEK